MNNKRQKHNKEFITSAKKTARYRAIIDALNKITEGKQQEKCRGALYFIKEQAHNTKILIKYKAAQRIYGVY